ncbi:MAG: HAD hydrolase-like protein [Synergistaceae bacterium]|jgi:HAD superfamily hydrolase (TIGR01509 family)|nr:HAD hydrolase-like protein [Synergistaceae bacterium]
MTFKAPFWSPSQASAALFDWDGVIAETNLDFTEVRKKYFGGRPAMLLEDMASLEPAARAGLKRDLEDMELRGAERARFVPGAEAVLEWVGRSGIPWAVVSRNCGKSIEKAAAVMGMTLPRTVRSRDDGRCVKPDPRALCEVCGELSADPAQTLLIGDHIYDMMGARRAGMRGVLVRSEIAPGWEKWLELRCRSMSELLSELSSASEIVPWEYQETVLRFGRKFLASAYKITLKIPETCKPSLDSWIAAAASLGVGGFEPPDGRFEPSCWKSSPSFDPSYMGLDMKEAVRRFLRTRWPFASVREGGGSLEPPPRADELADFVESAAGA